MDKTEMDKIQKIGLRVLEVITCICAACILLSPTVFIIATIMGLYFSLIGEVMIIPVKEYPVEPIDPETL